MTSSHESWGPGTLPEPADARADVVVLGGGPAGSAAARRLASWGHHVVLLTRAPNPRWLAESLPPSAGKLLDRVGVRRAVDEAGFIRSTGNTVWWGASTTPRAESFGSGALGWQVPRRAFDRLMTEQAEAAGSRVVRGALVRNASLEPGGRSWIVEYDVGPERRTMASPWLLDCTGRAGLLARRAWRRPDPGGHTLALVGIWERRQGWRMLADATHTLVESYDGGWAWSVPASVTRRYVTVMVDPALTELRSEADPDRQGREPGGASGFSSLYMAELAKVPHLHEICRGQPRPARLTSRPFARDASSYAAERFSGDGLLLVGDAASFIDPLSSYGIKKALSSAWLASIVVHTALSNTVMLGAALELYERRERAMYQGLRRRFAELSVDAAGAREEAPDFWRARAATGEDIEEGDPDVATLRRDPQVLSAFEMIRQRPSVCLHPAAGLGRVERPTVRDDRVVLEEHLVAPAFSDGVRYIRSIDLVKLAELAPSHDQVPDLYAAYNRVAPPASLPDFLGALSVLVGKGMLDLA